MAQAPHPAAAREPRLSYRSAGVASSEEMRSFGRAIDLFRSTHGFARRGRPLDFPGVAEPYAAVLDLGANLGLAIATDGVGTKLLVAEALGKYDTVGIDCVAMNANDILCVGAEPVAMVDYAAVKSTNNDQLFELAKGLVDGARLAHISIPGGETAQVAEMLAGGAEAFDLVGTCVGTVPLDAVITGERVAPGDALIGYASTGIHSNGLTLARRVFERARRPARLRHRPGTAGVPAHERELRLVSRPLTPVARPREETRPGRPCPRRLGDVAGRAWPVAVGPSPPDRVRGRL